MNASPASTKERILDAAERLFAQFGFEATSLRAITAEAGVNLGAVNYHFQSKEALVHAVVGRRLGPVNQARMQLLDRFEAEAAGRPVPIPQLLQAFLAPVLEMKRSAPNFVPLAARVYTEPESFRDVVFRKHIQGVAERFLAAFQRALPDLPQEELYWRISFVGGAMALALCGGPFLHALSGGKCDVDDVEAIIARMINFFGAAMTVPATVQEVQYAH
jgi:AcrR family transcriptional regulator